LFLANGAAPRAACRPSLPGWFWIAGVLVRNSVSDFGRLFWQCARFVRKCIDSMAVSIERSGEYQSFAAAPQLLTRAD